MSLQDLGPLAVPGPFGPQAIPGLWGSTIRFSACSYSKSTLEKNLFVPTTAEELTPKSGLGEYQRWLMHIHDGHAWTYMDIHGHAYCHACKDAREVEIITVQGAKKKEPALAKPPSEHAARALPEKWQLISSCAFVC